ncbi:hypothetical protein HMPREF9130_1556 [Peptoniphilus sp. oral taxon 375 str. F0436]|nr:hypothetical protein HMPREF9130_1556 [Peptoniphilus sp. oral taxon 375 str. F0436]
MKESLKRERPKQRTRIIKEKSGPRVTFFFLEVKKDKWIVREKFL